MMVGTKGVVPFVVYENYVWEFKHKQAILIILVIKVLTKVLSLSSYMYSFMQLHSYSNLINYIFSLKNSHPCWDLNLGSPRYQAYMLPTELSWLGLPLRLYSFSVCWLIFPVPNWLCHLHVSTTRCQSMQWELSQQDLNLWQWEKTET